MATGPKIPISCTTIELKDLADITDFEKEGEVDAIYALQLTQDGYYKRKEIDDNNKPRFPKFDQLRNVETDGYQEDTKYNLVHKDKKWILQETTFDDLVDTSNFTENIQYNIVHKNGKWIIVNEDIDWLIKFEFKSPVTLVGKTNTLKKALNSGPLLTSLIPLGSDIAVKPFKRNQYLIHRLDTATGATILNFQPEVVLGNQATIILDLVVKPLNDKIAKTALINTLSDGISIEWTPTEVEEVRTVIAIDKDGSTVRKMSSDNKINLSLDPTKFTSLKSINLTHVELIGFYYIDRVLPEEVLQGFIEEITK